MPSQAGDHHRMVTSKYSVVLHVRMHRGRMIWWHKHAVQMQSKKQVANLPVAVLVRPGLNPDRMCVHAQAMVLTVCVSDIEYDSPKSLL